MIAHPAFPAEPWSVRETTLDLDLLGQTESVFALANGHIGLRANLDEGAPVAIPGQPRRRAPCGANQRGHR
jgi:alpha,alpha-trehalose phosphorylase